MDVDDTQLYTSTTFNNLYEPLYEPLTEINKLTTILEIYFNYNYLKCNKLKIDCILIHYKLLIPLPHIKIANTEIYIKSNITTLGFMLDKHLTLNIQISSIVK